MRIVAWQLKIADMSRCFSKDVKHESECLVRLARSIVNAKEAFAIPFLRMSLAIKRESKIRSLELIA